jgi:heterotetrameric sarcosine oxidase gamma subunit
VVEPATLPDVVPAVARSPIRPAEPVAVRRGWEVSSRRSDAALRLVDCAPLAKVVVRGAPNGTAAAALGVRFGRAERDRAGTLVVGSGPGEWMLLGEPGQAGALAARAAALPDGRYVAAVDVTHGRALMRLTGRDAAQALAKVCAIDFSDRATPNGRAFRSAVAELATDVVRDDRSETPSYLLHCERSSGQYLFDALLDAGAEFDIDIDGCRDGNGLT